MKKPTILKQNIDRLGRILLLLFNRATMYQIGHPYIKQSIDEFYSILNTLLSTISPIVLILNRGQLFIDEEPIDPRVNVGRIVSHFKKTGVQSISFDEGLNIKEIKIFLEIFTSPNKYPTAETMQKALVEKGIKLLKINHVFYKKITADDEVISREILKKVTPHMSDDAEHKSKKLFLNMVLESVIAEEFEKNLNIKNLMSNPVVLTKNMIEADLNSFNISEAEDRSHGPVLLHQLKVIKKEVENSISKAGETDTSILADAVFEMRKKLIDGIEAQKAMDIAYSNEKVILDQVDEITDSILIKIVKDEYKAGKITTSRLAQILRRLMPEADELKRLLPKIKKVLLEEGMPLAEYASLVQEIGKELQSEGLAKIFSDTSEELGLDSKELIQEMKENPVEVAELVSLATEIKKGTGDEKALTDILVDYVERLGSKANTDMTKKDDEGGEQHLRQVITGLESNVVSQLRKMDISDDVLGRLEKNLNNRMDEILGKLRIEWIKSQPGEIKEIGKDLSLLQTLEQSVNEGEELGKILQAVRSKVQSEEVDENDFNEIYAEIARQKEIIKEREAKKKMPAGVLKTENLTFFLEKEISRARRYDIPFAALAYSIVEAKPENPAPSGSVTQQDLIEAILERLFNIMRDTDVVGIMGKNIMVTILPMTPQEDSKLALRRSMKLLHAEKVEVSKVQVNVKIAGVAINFHPKRTPDVQTFVKAMSTDLMDMSIRVKNIHALI